MSKFKNDTPFHGGYNGSQELPPLVPHNHYLVEASAGSGKTTNLVLRIRVILLDDQLPSGILCVTFTREAVKSIKDKLYSVLISFSQGDFEERKKELTEQLKITKFLRTLLDHTTWIDLQLKVIADEV